MYSTGTLTDRVIAFAQGMQPNGYRNVALVRFLDREGLALVGEDELSAALVDSTHLSYVQCFVPSKGNGSVYRSYQCSIQFSEIDKSFSSKIERVGVSAGIFGSSHLSTGPSMDRIANEVNQTMPPRIPSFYTDLMCSGWRRRV